MWLRVLLARQRRTLGEETTPQGGHRLVQELFERGLIGHRAAGYIKADSFAVRKSINREGTKKYIEFIYGCISLERMAVRALAHTYANQRSVLWRVMPKRGSTTANHSRTVFVADIFGRARVVSSTNTIPSNSCISVVGMK